MSYNSSLFEINENPSLIQIYNFILTIYPLLSEYEKNIFDTKTFYSIDKYITNKNTIALESLLTRFKNDNNNNITNKIIINNNITNDNTISNDNIQKFDPKNIFYLGGQCRYTIDTPITYDMIQKVEEINSKINMNESWNMEYYSILEHKHTFYLFKTFYENYKFFIEHIKYSPDNIGYNEAKLHFENF